jgi:4-diphosphocytidyl-2-C-methyl-D-erythritol kinase
MAVTVRSFAKINLGLRIGALRPDGYHELRTVYQTIGLHDLVRVQPVSGSRIEIRCEDPRVPTDESNTCYRIVARALAALKVRRGVVIDIEKRLPVQGGLGGASGNAVAALLALERALGKPMSASERLRIAAEVGSDLPLFLIGGTVIGSGRGEEVYPAIELPAMACVVATPDIGVSTPRAFADWDLVHGEGLEGSAEFDRDASQTRDYGFAKDAKHRAARPDPLRLRSGQAPLAKSGRLGMTTNLDPSAANSGLGMTTTTEAAKLTGSAASDRMLKFGHVVSAWLTGLAQNKFLSGVPGNRSRGRAETPLLDLVHTGIENDFEEVVFPQYPALRQVKRAMLRAGASYASLSGSGSAIYGLFSSRKLAAEAALKLREKGIPAHATATLTRQQYWKKFLVSSF